MEHLWLVVYAVADEGEHDGALALHKSLKPTLSRATASCACTRDVRFFFCPVASSVPRHRSTFPQVLHKGGTGTMMPTGVVHIRLGTSYAELFR